MKILKMVSKFITIIVPIIFMIFGAFVYAPEYNGSDGKPSMIKSFLEITIPISTLTIIIIILVIIWAVSGGNLIFILKIEKQMKEKNHYKQMYEKLLENIKQENSRRPLEKKILDRIKILLPVEKMLDFTRDHDFGNKFPLEYIKMMGDFLLTENNPEYKFQDIKFEELRMNLIKVLKELNLILAENSEGVAQTELYRIRRELKSDKPELYSKIIRESNECATNAWELYDKLICEGKQLYIE
ncbi:hypothetical protein [Clostridium beijerinckii]|uniref:hypothetical protein n=1 Tax=Clostridium beijerinckii TaxID=1520 RepID=UPI00242ABAD8|nr:hypothetical protein [Clostridium beijerinckii]MDG5854382.1 hypothetical protein [Clostridium beijerinckii]